MGTPPGAPSMSVDPPRFPTFCEVNATGLHVCVLASSSKNPHPQIEGRRFNLTFQFRYSSKMFISYKRSL
eukprot:1434694-Amphidinium_carterae.1